MESTIVLEIYRDKPIFGEWRACRQAYIKHSYRIKGGEVQIKHAGKWWEIVEANEAHTNYLRDYYRERFNRNYDSALVRRIYK